MSDFIGASDRFAIISEFMQHRKDVVETVRRYRNIADAMLTMVESYGFCPEVVDQYEDSENVFVVFECEEENWSKFIALRTNQITGESMLFGCNIDGDLFSPLPTPEELVEYLTTKERITPKQEQREDELNYFITGSENIQ